MTYQTKLNEKRLEIEARIEELLLKPNFDFKIDYLIQIHKYLFNGVVPFAGKFRNCNLSKKEQILNGHSVIYTDYKRILLYLDYDFENEKKINYPVLSKEELIKKIADFTLRIWLIHPFRDGNTRTISVFIQKYLNSLGYDVDNNIIKENWEYFRNALVSSGYYNTELCIHRDLSPLITFFEKLLVDSNIKLNSENLYIKELFYRSNNSYKKVLKK